MKQLLLTFVYFSGLSANAQMTTLFEAGTGVPQGVIQGFGTYGFHADESGAFLQVGGVWSDTMKVQIINTETVGGADLWLIKRIPQMDIYAELEFFTDATLPPNSIFTYSVSTDSITWNSIPSADANVPVTFDNNAGNKFVKLNIHIDPFDTTRFTVNYVSVKANSHVFVGLEEQTNETISVSAANGQLSIHAAEGEAYDLVMYNMAGQSFFSASGKGEQLFEPAFSDGICLVQIAARQQLTTTRIYFR